VSVTEETFCTVKLVALFPEEKLTVTPMVGNPMELAIELAEVVTLEPLAVKSFPTKGEVVR
jgi:hypothetical protein